MMTADIKEGEAKPRLLTFAYSEHQGFTLYLDELRIGYYAASAFDILAMMYVLRMLALHCNIEFSVSSNAQQKLLDWINARV